jgi:hypothetical protein
MGAQATRVDGIRFASRLEADRYCELKLLQAAGDVVYFLRQVPFDLAPGVTYRADFLVVWSHGSREPVIEDTKGYLTATARVKLRVVESRYPVKIKILTRKEVSRCL